MEQIKKCNGEKCDIKKLCKRYKMKINPFNQKWIDPKYKKDEGCKNYILND